MALELGFMTTLVPGVLQTRRPHEPHGVHSLRYFRFIFVMQNGLLAGLG